MTRIFRHAAPAALLALAACGDSSGPGDGRARVNVHLTDAPGDVRAAVVTISEVYLQGGAAGRVTLRNTPFTVDLTTLANATTELVAGADVEAGSYSELRFVITGGYVEVENAGGGTSIYASSSTYAGLPPGAVVAGELQMPSLAQSGLKVDFESALALDGTVDLLVDFDVAQSFGRQAGQSNRWVMHPVIKGGRLEAAATVTASLRLGGGVTLPAVNGGAVTLGEFRARLGATERTFTDADGDGVYTATFRFVLPGSYSLAVVAPVGLVVATAPLQPVALAVGAGAQARTDFTITGAARAP
jgi:hypothetical protein